jgi:hypothetical protein
MHETLSHIPEFEQTEPARRELTLADAKRYIIEHRDEPAFKDDQMVVEWRPIDALPSFETHCNALRASGSPELYRARELTNLIDRETHSGGHAKMTEPTEITLLLAPDIGKRFDDVPFADSLEKLEARVARDSELATLRDYEAHPDAIEPILGLIEDRVAWIDHEIERENRTPNKDARDERAKRNKIKTLEENRKKFRRARIFLLDQYFK